MNKYPETKVKNHIEKRIKSIEKYSRKMVRINYFGLSDDELKYEPIEGIKLVDLKFTKPKNDYTEYTTKTIFDLEFSLDYKNIKYIFETSNYYLYKDVNKFIVEDILDNIDDLIHEFNFLLEMEDFIFDYDDEKDEDNEDDNMTIDEVADSCGFYIDDDGHWIPHENDYFFDDIDKEDIFRDNLDFENGYYVYDDIDINGKFYWKA